MSSISRRQFLRSAGGLTFLALSPIGRGLFAAPAKLKPLLVPIFTALPYVQPGPEGKLTPGDETMRLAWQTQQAEASFEVTFGLGEAYDRTASIVRTQRSYRGKSETDSRYNYVTSFPSLELATEYRYRVRCNGELIIEGYFTTRQPRGRAVRFVAFGDNSFGDISDRAIAYQSYRAHPDFIMNAGDNVYEGGLDTEYARYFFPVYNADLAGPNIGAPLMRSVPFYTVLGNHDVKSKRKDVKGALADFDSDPDSLAYFSNFYLPLNGPPSPSHPTRIMGKAEILGNFKACAGERYPRMANYSYDYGDAHFLCFDTNAYVDPLDPLLVSWMESDLSSTDARWKFVVGHHPPFNVGVEHYEEQQLRALAPLFEKHKVDFVLCGHEHNYQRSVPMRFAPKDVAGAKALNEKKRMVPGTFTLDSTFDGVANTKPDGVIYLVTGAGGKHLYDEPYMNNPAKWTWKEDDHTAYVAQLVSDRHSISVFDLDGDHLSLRQIDERGNEIDRIVVTKA